MEALPMDATGEILDLDRYPLLDVAGRAAVLARARAGLAEDGCAVLPGFVRAAAVARMAAEAEATIGRAHRRDLMLRAYDRESDDPLPADHPGRRQHPYCMHVTAMDRLDPAGEIRLLYAWDGLTGFIRDMLDEPCLYRCADPLLSCAITLMGAGDQHGWHFDGNDFVITLLLQQPEAGGEFEFAPGIRQEGDAAVAAAMEGRSPRLRRPPVEAGTLVVFRGKDSLHRVTPVVGRRRRVIAVFSYDRRPDMMFTAQNRLQAVGRTEPDAA